MKRPAFSNWAYCAVLTLLLAASAAWALPAGWTAEQTDAQALTAFMNTFDNGEDILGANWTGDDPCAAGAAWRGVTCKPGPNSVDKVFNM